MPIRRNVAIALALHNLGRTYEGDGLSPKYLEDDDIRGELFTTDPLYVDVIEYTDWVKVIDLVSADLLYKVDHPKSRTDVRVLDIFSDSRYRTKLAELFCQYALQVGTARLGEQAQAEHEKVIKLIDWRRLQSNLFPRISGRHGADEQLTLLGLRNNHAAHLRFAVSIREVLLHEGGIDKGNDDWHCLPFSHRGRWWR